MGDDAEIERLRGGRTILYQGMIKGGRLRVEFGDNWQHGVNHHRGRGSPRVGGDVRQDDGKKREERDRKSTRLNSSHLRRSRMPSSA